MCVCGHDVHYMSHYHYNANISIHYATLSFSCFMRPKDNDPYTSLFLPLLLKVSLPKSSGTEVAIGVFICSAPRYWERETERHHACANGRQECAVDQ